MKCPRHPKFELTKGLYYRAANLSNEADWQPKNEALRVKYYSVIIKGNMEETAEIFGEAAMIHSNETSAGSPFISVAKCPACLAQSTDPTVISIIQNADYICVLNFLKEGQKPMNAVGGPYVLEIGGEGIGATETEALVLPGPDRNILKYHDGYITKSYLKTLIGSGSEEKKSEGKTA